MSKNASEPLLPLGPDGGVVVTGQKVGYARVSSKDQNLDRQRGLLDRKHLFLI